MLKPRIVFGLSCLLIAAMVLSPFLLSLSMFCLAGVAVLTREDASGFKIKINREAWVRIKNILRYPAFAVLSLSFLIVLLSFWQTEDWSYWQDRLRIKAPFLLLPLLFLALPKFSERELKGLLYFMLGLFTVTNSFVLYFFLKNQEQVIEMMKQGHPMWTPRNHIRYSLLLAWAVIGGIHLIRNGFYWKFRWEKYLIGALTLLAFLFIHFLSVKSGILMLYVGIVALIVHYIVSTKKYLIGLVAMTLMVTIPYLGYHLLPTLKRKIDYTIHDFKMYTQGKGGEYSDAGRIASLQCGLTLALKHPLLGVGAGNLRKEIHACFGREYPDYREKLMPQNQFIFVWAGTGLLGLIIFAIAFFFPLFWANQYQNELLFTFYAMQFVTIMIEHAYENAVGVAHYLFFLLLLLSVITKRPS